MTTGCYKTSLFLFANTRRAGTLLTVKCPAPGTHCETNARGLPGGDAHRWNLLAHKAIEILIQTKCRSKQKEHYMVVSCTFAQINQAKLFPNSRPNILGNYIQFRGGTFPNSQL